MALKPNGASKVLQTFQLGGKLVQKNHGVQLTSAIQGMAIYVL